jgi:hypothetical protein
MVGTPAPPTATFGAPIEQLDIGTVVKASQAVSGEIVLSRPYGQKIEPAVRITRPLNSTRPPTIWR